MTATPSQQRPESVSFGHLLAFFIPLGMASSLTSLTHMIINGTLARSEQADLVIAGYAVVFSLFLITEKPALVLRQTSAALARDRASFYSVMTVSLFVISIMLAVGLIIGYSPVGRWAFVHVFRAEPEMVAMITQTFRVMMWVVLFSGFRCLYQGLMIRHQRTCWITIGVLVRLVVMMGAASYMIVSGGVNSSVAGAWLFLFGMATECLISVWQGNRMLSHSKGTGEGGRRKKTILAFYSPLVLYFFVQTLLNPMIYIFLAQTMQVERAMASFALAYVVTQSILSFFTYTHQIVLQFFHRDRRRVMVLAAVVNKIPFILISGLCFTSLGPLFMQRVLGTSAELAETTLSVLVFFLLKALIFPWVDFCNGFLMLVRRTKMMILTQSMNLFMTFVCLLSFITFVPEWNGKIGALSASVGELAELAVVLVLIKGLTVNRLKP